jgi:CheY-specific phosphatase CheX
VYTEHFLNAAEEFFYDINLPLVGVEECQSIHNLYELTGSLGITGSIHGYLVLQSEMLTAHNLVMGMATRLGVSFDELDFGPFHRATIGEIANQIAGKAIMKLETCGISCTITPPTIFIGKGISMTLPSSSCVLERTLIGNFGMLHFFVGLTE